MELGIQVKQIQRKPKNMKESREIPHPTIVILN
jgi:hypothetical protein